LPFFEDQVEYISHKFRAISIKEFWAIRTGRLKPIKNSIVLTFDDGYLDNWIWAYPVLKKFGLKMTIFVSPDFVDKKGGVRPNLDDVWDKRAEISDLNQAGFLSWQEMRKMEASGLVEIQSHTMTHTKYFVSDRIDGFHHPGSDCLYPIGNLFPERKPYYIGDPEFEKLLPYGYPFLEQASSVIANRIKIKKTFIDAVVNSLEDIDWTQAYSFPALYSKAEPVYRDFKNKGAIIERIESEKEYKKRVYFELEKSKAIIEKMMDKKVEFLCWPHGDSNKFAQKAALDIGYKATTLGKSTADKADAHRFERFGLGTVRNRRILSIAKARFKLRSYMGRQPDMAAKKIYDFLRDRF